jgi:hypothetical protein
VQTLLGFLGLSVGWAIVGVPLTWLAIASGRKEPEKAKSRAVPWAIAIAAWTGLIIGGLGFFFGAAIPDENAGAAAMALLGMGCFAGAPVGGVGSWVVITRRVKSR